MAERGYEVTLAEAGRALGGRVARERRLPGRSAWGRVADYRVCPIGQKANVATDLDSALNVEGMLAFGSEHVCIATGARWRRDGMGRQHVRPMPIERASPRCCGTSTA